MIEVTEICLAITTAPAPPPSQVPAPATYTAQLPTVAGIDPCRRLRESLLHPNTLTQPRTARIMTGLMVRHISRYRDCSHARVVGRAPLARGVVAETTADLQLASIVTAVSVSTPGPSASVASGCGYARRVKMEVRTVASGSSFEIVRTDRQRRVGLVGRWAAQHLPPRTRQTTGARCRRRARACPRAAGRTSMTAIPTRSLARARRSAKALR